VAFATAAVATLVRARSELDGENSVLDIIYVAAILALGAVVLLVAKGVEKL
jgi:hypothetical protein